MKEYWSLGILGLYTIIYVIVFIIQRSEIKATKGINESMKSFMDIFKIDEVRKYVELKHERVMMEVHDLIYNDEKLKEVLRKEIMLNNEILEMNKKGLDEEHMELVMFTLNVLKKIPLEKRQEFTDKNLPKTKQFFLDKLENYENNKV